MRMKDSIDAPASGLPKPADLLREIFLERRGRNGAYSTRAFARDIGMSQALVSLVFNEKRGLTPRQAAKVGMLLDLPAARAEGLLKSALYWSPESGGAGARSAPKRGSFFHQLEMEQFKAISQWQHLAILDLATTAGFKSETSWIARRLGISRIEAQDSVARLLRLKLLERREGKLVKSHQRIYFGAKASSSAVRNHHRQMIQKAVDELGRADQESFDQREISSLTLAADPQRLPRAKKLVAKFKRDLAKLLAEGPCSEVYQLNLQLFPLSQPLNNSRQKGEGVRNET